MARRPHLFASRLAAATRILTSRNGLTRLALAGAVLVGIGGVPEVLRITPTTWDFGQVVVNGAGNQMFQVDFTNPGYDSLDVAITGPDAASFSINRGVAPSPASGALRPASTCLMALPRMPAGSCLVEVLFRPTSEGRKSATLEVIDTKGKNKGNTLRATLKGEGIFGCRQYLVHCNYADFYSGSLTFTTLDSTIKSENRYVRMLTSIRIDVRNGVATCSGTQNDVEEDRHGGKVRVHSASAGPISGPGLFAVEFAPRGRDLVYQLSFACPTASLVHTFIDYEANTNGTDRTPADSAQWSQYGTTDEHPVAKIGADLEGKQVDVTSEPENDKGAYTKMEWSLKRK